MWKRNFYCALMIAAASGCTSLATRLTTENSPSAHAATLDKFKVVSDEVREKTVQELAEKLSFGSIPERKAAANALLEIGPGSVRALPALIDALRSSEVEIVWSAARTIAALGQNGEDAVRALEDKLRELPCESGAFAESGITRGHILNALKVIGPRSASVAGTVVGLLACGSVDVAEIVGTLNGMGRGADAALPVLRDMLETGNFLVKDRIREVAEKVFPEFYKNYEARKEDARAAREKWGGKEAEAVLLLQKIVDIPWGIKRAQLTGSLPSKMELVGDGVTATLSIKGRFVPQFKAEYVEKASYHVMVSVGLSEKDKLALKIEANRLEKGVVAKFGHGGVSEYFSKHAADRAGFAKFLVDLEKKIVSGTDDMSDTLVRRAKSLKAYNE